MNKQLLSFVLLMSAVSANLVFADNQMMLPGGCIRKDEVHHVFASPHSFTIKAELTVTPSNYEKWELIDADHLELLRYTFTGSGMAGSAGTQEWVFTTRVPGYYEVAFKRNNEVKSILIEVHNDFAWCGKRKPAEPIIL